MTIPLQQNSETLVLRTLRAWTDPDTPEHQAVAAASDALQEMGQRYGELGAKHLALSTSRLAGQLWHDHQPDHSEERLREVLEAAAGQRGALISTLISGVLTAWAAVAAEQSTLEQAAQFTDEAYATAVQKHGAVGMHTLYGVTVRLTAALATLEAKRLGTTVEALLDGVSLVLHERAAG
ncbi:hypothetical protein [Streptomyces sp. NPDC048659]|uniref:hypothetical protein n=1 Tax=Streptomyces sp. NPDC048659 TaxID=3155489 RepID=UPI003426D7F1